MQDSIKIVACQKKQLFMKECLFEYNFRLGICWTSTNKRRVLAIRCTKIGEYTAIVEYTAIGEC